MKKTVCDIKGQKKKEAKNESFFIFSPKFNKTLSSRLSSFLYFNKSFSSQHFDCCYYKKQKNSKTVQYNISGMKNNRVPTISTQSFILKSLTRSILNLKLTITKLEAHKKATATLLAFILIFQTISGVFFPLDIINKFGNIAVHKADAAWYSVGGTWSYRKEITIDSTKVLNTDQLNFPILISHSDSALKHTSNGGKVTDLEGDDIIFISSDGNTKLDHEIEKYDNSTGEIVSWVKIPTLSSSADTTIYIYYANSAITTSQENISSVWDDGGADNFKMVQHLNEDPSGSAPQSTDSTQYNNDGTSGGTMLTEDQIAGQIDGSLDFDGSDDYVESDDSASLDISDALTISAWINSDSMTNAYDDRQTIATKRQSYYFELDAGVPMIYLYGVGGWYLATSTLLANNWYYVTATYSGSQVVFYVNGINAGSDNVSGTIDQTTYPLRIGWLDNAVVPNNRYFDGQIDEVRISNIARSVDWITTEYNNQSQPTEFYSLGIEESQSPVDLSAWSYRKAITIDNTKISGSTNLINFPFLIDLPTDVNLQASAQVDADDILFTTSVTNWSSATQNDKLAHEIESYISATGELQVWVKLPVLDYNDDTIIYMYYGNASITSQQNSTAVWGSNQKMIQHLSADPSGSAPQSTDSTQYNNNGTSGGTMLTEDQIAGQIDGSLDFDGVDDYVDLSDYGSRSGFNTSTGAIEMWFNPTGDGYFSQLLNFRKTSIRDFIIVREINESYIRFFGEIDDVVQFDLSTPAGSISAGNWSHFVFQQTGSGIEVYINGERQTLIGSGESATMWLADVFPASQDFTIGHHGSWQDGVGTAYFNGQIDEVRISNTIRGTDWILTEYNNQSLASSFSTLSIEQVYEIAITGSAVQTAGLSQTITITAKDAESSVIANFTGDKSVIFSGANDSPNSTAPTCTDKDAVDIDFGSATILTFTNGVATCDLKLYKDEIATITTNINYVTDTNLDITVSPAALENFFIDVPENANYGVAFPITITARDIYQNTTTNVSGNITFSVDQNGTIIPSTVANTNFTDDGTHTDNFTITNINGQSSVTIIVANESSTGTDNILILVAAGGVIVRPTPPIINSNFGLPSIQIIQTDGKKILISNVQNSYQMAISTTLDFQNVSWEPYRKEKELNFSSGITKLYVKFRSITGGETKVIEKEIIQNFESEKLLDGDIIRIENDYKIYVKKGDYLRHIPNPIVFSFYNHLKWNKIVTITQQQFNQFKISNLVRELNDNKVYETRDSKTKHWLNVLVEQFVRPNRSWDMVYIVNNRERDFYDIGVDVK
ncbi:DUF2341 domain-containing protein [Candidatus Parcubacteria bacterium]|nr:DUF2341 domain-containing protein [Candidatus Parcubacteria bacterium]